MKHSVLKLVSLILVISILASLTAYGFSVAHAETADGGKGAVETIMTAGTTQAFSDETVPEEDVKTILQAGLAAESAINQQPWYFVAITNKDVMAEIAGSGGGFGGGSRPADPPSGDRPSAPQGGSMPGAPQGGSMSSAPQSGGSAKASLGDSPLAIVVYMNEKTSSPNPSFDCGLAVQNMYIAAASLGYGAKIISSPTRTLNGANHDQICEKLGVDPALTAVAVLLIGKPASDVDGVSGTTTRTGLEDKTSIIG